MHFNVKHFNIHQKIIILIHYSLLFDLIRLYLDLLISFIDNMEDIVDIFELDE